MKILALADRKITEDLNKIITEQQIDLVLLLGDLKYSEICDLQECVVPILGVLGNHCSFDYISHLQGTNLHQHHISLLNESFFGYQGCPFYKGGQFESTQDECLKVVEAQTSGASILIAHSPASGINSTHMPPHEGFLGLTKYLDKFIPKLFFHGHSYPDKSQKISKYKSTIVYFVEGMEIIDTESLLSRDNYPLAKTY